jgi:hypothetical protein
VCRLTKNTFELSLTTGGLVYATHGTGSNMQAQNQTILQQNEESSVIHSDETCWYVSSSNY